ncbi:MAG: phage major tail protein, TP901-1 family [Roseitalea sp.]|jgi:TP901-1 family phage major tail protein|uniref:Phage major tail protein, TP901-1 family n=1 Tax=Oceaniradius stylonematis TaxID=2184161 RepID=A0A3A8AG99_9HYPH|nr:phage major tail protein, TP901-1 family [Oceaniradius stylonematis]MBO6554600.1 phage major tail protein, TP901-1 family [Roseitalea sp.]MBO6953643.1 phage major tail protein, TP901-1 family [Rhizobiaceae bacterium]RNC93548.1 MAG: phage major tail protein, TP901-1 family [Oricola sp.]MBO6593928.1 phage major tail protein, TP901-1 family [Roseitalea sp.]MBO6601387.1 phage major tail protein, TP901-1 family [Roseitalea sp.]
MTAQRGKDILLKFFDDGQQAFVSVAGLRTKRIAFNAQTVDITDTESAGRWRELLGGAGVRRASISGSGIFKDAASDALVRQAFFDGTIDQWEIVIPDFGAISGAFAITALDYAGNHDGEVTFETALESAGELTFGAL